MRSYLHCILFISFCISLGAQNTVGLISYNPNKALDGLNLYYPHNQPNVYLINNCGEIVHTWEGEADQRPGNTAYLLEDGRLVKTSRNANIQNDRIWAGGGGANVEIRDWDNNLEWSFTLNDSIARLHHDIAIIERGSTMSILMIVWELKTREEAIAMGRDTAMLQNGELWPDYLLEIDPATDEVVWEWHAWDHLIQDYDPTKANYGVIADNPQLLDINTVSEGNNPADWMHANCLDYDPVMDVVMLSVPHFSEVFIIDHSTTTEQAATSSGGRSNRGGDFWFRWGNPMNYDQGTEADKTLFFQHDANFIDDFVDVFDPNYGKISVFNNRAGTDYSTFNIFEPQFEMYDNAYTMMDGRFLPDGHDFTGEHPIDRTDLFSTGLSSFQYLRNGNSLVTSGRFGYTFEMTPDNEIVWEYITPINRGAAVEQGDTTLAINNNLTFRVTRYPMEYEAFDGRDLSPKGFIELNPDTAFCNSIINSTTTLEEVGMNIYPNPAQDMITLEWDNGKYITVEIIDQTGRRIVPRQKINGGRKYFDTSTWTTGLYVVRVNEQAASKILIMNN